MPLGVEDIRRNIVVAVGLILVFAVVMWLAPEKDDLRTVFDAARPRQPVAATETADPAKGEPRQRRGDAAVPAQPGSGITQAARVAPQGTPSGPGDGAEPLERLPPRPPLSDDDQQPDTPKPRLLARPVALDGARVAYRQGVVTLPGVEALPLNERCGSGAEDFPCGVMARTELRRFLRGRSIACDVPDDFGLKRGEATSACTVGSEDIGRWVVENGWARAAPGGAYEEVEAAARQARRGIWR
ncbi:thermonuclease family protein [Aurantimonas sp. 22II-16-19i]|uniref:thermonuclease family protein n=1 Tax=Aurantimonas sp. 22II-16-19i TaxID=1317114 RepID=UPI0009FB5184|nr:thermonuclease family protein [Aurantimonas sp. 22II-16-19i]